MPGKALILVDVQKDFCPDGSYPVLRGNEVVEPLNRIIKHAKQNGWTIFASRDWHPRETQTMEGWTAHCVENTDGAEFHPKLMIDKDVIVISKGKDLSESHYSAFNGDDVNLSQELRARGVDEVFIGGLALDYCVKNTAIDAVKNGYKVAILIDASRGIFKRKSEVEVLGELREAGVQSITTKEAMVVHD